MAMKQKEEDVIKPFSEGLIVAQRPASDYAADMRMCKGTLSTIGNLPPKLTEKQQDTNPIICYLAQAARRELLG